MSDDPKSEKPLAEAAEGWEALSEEPSGGTLAPSEELEAALREASAAADERVAQAAGEPDARSTGGSVDKITIEALSNELQALKEQYEETLVELEVVGDKHLRLQAEFENFRRRSLKERQEAHSYGHQNVVKDLVPSVDSLDRAIEHAEQSDGGDLQALLQGVQLVRRELLGVLAKHGVSEIEAAGMPFDPAVHEAMAQVPTREVEPNTVVQVLEKGYVLRSRMLRPARVVVGREPGEGETPVPIDVVPATDETDETDAGEDESSG